MIISYERTIARIKIVSPKTTKWIFVGSLVLLTTCIWLYWHKVYSQPQRVFWGAIENALKTPSFNKQTLQASSGNSYNEKISVKSSGQQLVSGHIEIRDVSQGQMFVLYSLFGTPDADRIRYDAIQISDDKNQKTKDYSKVIGKWGINMASGGLNPTSGEQYSQAVMGALPHAAMDLDSRHNLLKIIHQNSVYQPNFSSLKREISDGRPVYTYNVIVKPDSYIKMLKAYADIVGFSHLDGINPDDFADRQNLNFQFVIDVWTRQVTKIITGAEQSVSQEVFSAIGQKQVDGSVPKDVIPMQELQTIFSQI